MLDSAFNEIQGQTLNQVQGDKLGLFTISSIVEKEVYAKTKWNNDL
jgi:hypothetical protein